MTKPVNFMYPEEWLAGGAMLAVMCLGFWQAVLALGSPAVRDLPLTLNDFRQGNYTNGLSTQMDKNLPWRSELIGGANAVRYVLTQGAGEQVRIGQGDWLFLTEELQYDPLGDSNMAARVQLLSKTSHGLAQKGVQLVVALVPDKARVHPEHWSAAGYPAYNATRYSQALTHLNKAGVMAVDLLGPLQQAAKNQSVYYRSDTHWNQEGAKVAASVIATHIASLNTQLDEATFVTTTQATAVERPGDLIRLMGLEHMPNMLRPKPDTETTELTTQTSADQATGLFGDSAVGVVLTGTSYSLRGNFHGHLQQALRTKVLNVAKDGGGLLQATGAYLADESFKTTPPKVLLWEVPERFLTLPLDKEAEWLKTTALSAPGKP